MCDYMTRVYEVILATVHDIAGTKREDILKLFKEQKGFFVKVSGN